MFYMYMWLIPLAIIIGIALRYNNFQGFDTMIECKICKNKIARTADICPHCGAPTQKKISDDAGRVIVKVIAPVLAVICVLIFLLSDNDNNKKKSNYYSNNYSATQSNEVYTPKEDTALITLEEYNRLHTGMTYEHCCEIIGVYGTLTSEVVIMDIKTTVYTWKGNGGLGSNAVLTFQDGYLSSRVMIGLK